MRCRRSGQLRTRCLSALQPEHFVEAGQGAADVAVTVDVVENLGGTRACLRHDFFRRERRHRGASDWELKAGDSISFGIKPERAMLFSTSGTRLRNI